MRRPALAIILLAITAPLAGCVADSEGTSGADTPADGAGPAAPARFDENTGAITGTVTDDQIQPIEGADVGLLEQPETTTRTDASGAFTLSSLQPGTYTLVAGRLGFESAGKKVDVIPGTALTVSILLAPIPVAQARHQTYPFSGYIDCAFAIVRTTLSAGCGQGTTVNTQNIFKSGWPADFSALVFEAEWNSQTQPDWLAFDLVDRGINYYGVYYRYRGTTPAYFLAERCGDYRATAFGRAPMPCTEEQVTASKMQLETFYVGKLQEQTHLGDPVCRENITNPTGGANLLNGYQQGCYGVGVATQVRWTNYATVFHLDLPADIARFSARPDR
ncbi:MAG: carboxypeptidase regulatory-like domain-containing protein [Euryarchaeota archaeon]|nr:carboxypeptidase regulatory-like domain-containing protein [Euryarchaeota archaeon]